MSLSPPSADPGSDSSLSLGLPRRPFWRSLGGRIVGLFLGLLLGVQLLVFVTLREGIEANARQQLAEQLRLGERVLVRLLDQNGQTLGQAATLLAADYGFRDAVQSGDRDTIVSALDNHAERIGATVSALLDMDGAVRAVDHAAELPAPQVQAALQRLAEQARSHRVVGAERALALIGSQPFQLVVVPLKAPLPIGWVVMGFPLKASMAQELNTLSGLEVAFISQPAHGAAQVAVGSQAAAQQAAVGGWLPLPVGLSERALQGDRVAVRYLTLAGTQGGELHAVLYRSIDAAIAPYQRLQTTLIVITAVGVLLFVLGSVATAGRVTRPLRALLRATRRLGEGDFDTPVPTLGTRDELADLALAFDGMRVDLAQRTEDVRRFAFWDRLTGLPNRTQLEQALAGALEAAAASGAPLALIVLNLDRMTRVNQVLGRQQGDRLLCTAAERLAALMRRRAEQPGRQPGLLARLGGDEFALLLPGDGLEQAQALAREVVLMFERPVQLGDSAVDLSAAQGLAGAPLHGTQPDVLLSRALLALAEAKRCKAELVVYDPAFDAGSAQTLSLLGELRHALRHGELRLYLQPKLGLASGALVGAEALVRWQHPVRGLVPPAQFIPFAEETGFIHELTLWIVEEAGRVSARLREAGLNLRLSVNLSAHDLMRQDLVDRLGRRLAASGTAPSALCLEITESAIAADPQRALKTLHALKACGYKLSIDDFGAGYTSLGQLIDLPVDELKIDMLFVRTMDSNADKAAMVRFIVGLAHDCRLTVVAEGVENAAILGQLASLGCDEAQGYHVSKPMPADELPAWLGRRTAADRVVTAV